MRTSKCQRESGVGEKGGSERKRALARARENLVESRALTKHEQRLDQLQASIRWRVSTGALRARLCSLLSRHSHHRLLRLNLQKPNNAPQPLASAVLLAIKSLLGSISQNCVCAALLA